MKLEPDRPIAEKATTLDQAEIRLRQEFMGEQVELEEYAVKRIWTDEQGLNVHVFGRDGVSPVWSRAKQLVDVPLSVERVYGLDEVGFTYLDGTELREVRAASKSEVKNLAIAGRIDNDLKKVELIMGDRRMVNASFSQFKPSGDGTAPDFSTIEITDHGNTVKLGEYEASVDAVLKRQGS